MNDDDRIAYLSGDDVALAPEDRAELDELRLVLGDPSSWSDPPDGLEDRVAAAIAAEAAARPRRLAAPRPAPPASPVRLASARRRTMWRVAGVAAAVAIGVAVTANLVGRRATGGERFAVALTAPSGAAQATVGRADLARTSSGWRIELEAPGLARLDGGRFYEAWLRNAAGVLVPIGTFNEGAHVVLWAGVSPRDFPTLTVTEEDADGNQASSGRRVLTGTVALTG